MVFHLRLRRLQCQNCKIKFTYRCHLKEHQKLCLPRNEKEHLELDTKQEDHDLALASTPVVTSQVKLEVDESEGYEFEQPIFAEERDLPEILKRIESTISTVPKIMSGESRAEAERWPTSEVGVVREAALLSSEEQKTFMVPNSNCRHFCFPCKICGKAFRTNGLLSRHHKVVHLKMKESN